MISAAKVHLQKLSCEFERCTLKVDSAWGIWKHEPKINMDYMAIFIKQEICIVPILHLPQSTSTPNKDVMVNILNNEN